MSDAEELFAFQVRALKMLAPVRNYRFLPGRKFEIDFAWPELMVGIEIQGGIWRTGGGAHSRPANIERDIEKHNLLLDHGWRVWQFTTQAVKSGEAVQKMQQVLQGGDDGRPV
ncbi:MAG: hypothetical protein WCL08_10930 [Verrucomicrobiota bacterium]